MRKNLTLFDRDENRDLFFRRVYRFLHPANSGAQLLRKAYSVSKEAFRGIRRKRGERYFEHCRAVALIAMDILKIHDPEVITAALLHDVVEDCSEVWPTERVEHEFGKRVAQFVAALSIPTGEFTSREERMRAYHEQLILGPEGTLALKLADRLHNLSTCEALSVEAQWRMVKETEEHYLPIAKERNVLYWYLTRILAARKRMLNSHS